MELLSTIDKSSDIILGVSFIEHFNSSILKDFVSVLIVVHTYVVYHFGCKLILSVFFVIEKVGFFLIQSQEHSCGVCLGINLASTGDLLSLFKLWIILKLFKIRSTSHHFVANGKML